MQLPYHSTPVPPKPNTHDGPNYESFNTDNKSSPYDIDLSWKLHISTTIIPSIFLSSSLAMKALASS